MRQYKITNVEVTDSIDQIARECVISLAAEGRFGFELPDSIRDGVRPNKDVVQLDSTVLTNIADSLFNGIVRFTDGLYDINVDTATIHLADLPPGQPYNLKITFIENMSAIGEDAGTTGSTSAILRKVCSKAGLNPGIISLPDAIVCGIFEIARQNPVDVARSFCQPFNVCAAIQYIPRIRQDNLHIMKLDYTLEDTTPTIYNVQAIAKITNSNEEYPYSIGQGSILLYGADKYLNADINKDDHTTIFISETDHTFVQDSRQNNYVMGTSINERYSIQYTTFRFLVRVVYASEADKASFEQYAIAFNDPTLQAYGWVTFGDVALGYAAGFIKSYDIVSATPLTTRTEIYDSFMGLTETMDKTYEYKDIRFSKVYYPKPDPKEDISGMVGSFGNTQVDPTQYTRITLSETETRTLYILGEAFPDTKVHRWYCYDEYGTQTHTNVATYRAMRGGWYLESLEAQFSGGQETVNARVRFFMSELSGNIKNIQDAVTKLNERKTIYQAAVLQGIGSGMTPEDAATFAVDTQEVYAVLGGNTPFPPDYNPTGDPNLRRKPKPKLGRYMIFDGREFIQTDQVNALISRLRDLKEKVDAAFTMTIPYMEYAGLRKIYDLCLKQQQLESSGAFTHTIQVTCALDNSIYIGQQVQAGGYTGIVTKITHSIDIDKAITNFTMKRVGQP